MKKILGLILCCILILGITGCGNNNESENKNNNNSSNGSVQEESNSNVFVNEKTYYCSEKDDDDWYYYFYYENDELVKVKVLAAKWSGVFSEYSEIKADAESYKGVSISKDSDFAYYEIDIKNGGLKYLTENFYGFESLNNDTSWDNVYNVMQSVASQCEER